MIDDLINRILLDTCYVASHRRHSRMPDIMGDRWVWVVVSVISFPMALPLFEANIAILPHKMRPLFAPALMCKRRLSSAGFMPAQTHTQRVGECVSNTSSNNNKHRLIALFCLNERSSDVRSIQHPILDPNARCVCVAETINEMKSNKTKTHTMSLIISWLTTPTTANGCSQIVRHETEA